MKILITGRGTSGSWKIRGEQLGNAIGAIVEPNTSRMNGYDVAILIKRPRSDTLSRITSKPLIWDVVDSWPQPEGNEWNRDQCMTWLRGQVAIIKPAGIVAATQQMAMDCAEFGIPILALPHHARPGQQINPIRERVRTIGYEGGEQHLGWWRDALKNECKDRGAAFVVNPPSLSDLDIVVAVRAATGYAALAWKSNVKLANAQGSGTPIVCNRAAGYLEHFDLVSNGALWADDASQLSNCFDWLSARSKRNKMAGELLETTPTLKSVAQTYKAWLVAKFC